jgi:Protein of unknown function (DUF1703).
MTPNDGRLDCLVKTPTHIYVIEFKLNKSADEAMQQIKDKGMRKNTVPTRARRCWWG